jgi:dihydrofolate reductase
MRKLIFSIPITMDGYIEGPHRELDWVIPDDELHDFYADLLTSADLILYGRVTYLLMLSYWPNAPTDPATTAGMLRFAAALNPMKKTVYSSTLKDPGWNTQLVDSFNPDDIQKLKDQPGRPILLGGGASLAGQFMKHGLIDEYQLMVMPAVIGAGKSLFTGVDQPFKLNYQWSRSFASGAVVLCYQPDGKL